MPGCFQDEDAVVGVNVHGYRTAEAPLRFHVGPAARLDDVRVGVDISLGPWGRSLSVADQGSDECAVRAIDLDAVVGPVGDVYIAFRVYSDP